VNRASRRVFGRALAAAVALLLAACRGPQDAPPPIVLISIDTLRSDHLPAYGYTGVETPAIDQLARDGVRFDRVYSPAPLTAPAHASIFSGESPVAHGLRDNVGYLYDADRLPHLPHRLGEAGYATGAAISAFVLRGEVGFARGFDLYEDRIASRVGRGLSGIQRSGADTLAAALPWLRGAAAAERPFFFFLHLYEPHAPYAPPEPYASRYANRYAGEIAAADAVVGELLAELRRAGLYDRAAILLLSDHGEGLGEKGEEGHGVFLYRHDLQVPLIVKLPRQRHAGSSVGAVVGLADVQPTILELAGVELPAADRQRSLLSTIGRPATDRPVYSETWMPRLHFGWSELHSLIDGPLHYIHGPDPELYDLARDPHELVNLRDAQRRDFARLREQIAPSLQPLAAPQTNDEESRRKLAALGYIGSAAAPADAVLPDPKKMLHTLKYLQQGLELFAGEQPAAAAELLRKAVDANPFMVDAWDYLGRSYHLLGKPAEALAAFKESIRLSGGLPESALAAATVLVELGRPEEALLLIEHQIERSPEDLRLRFLRTRLLLAEGDVAAAERTAHETLALAPANPDSHYQIGLLAMSRRELDGAERAFRQALTLDADHAATLADLGVLLASTGRAAEAVPLLERLVRLRPDDGLARQNLARARDAAVAAR